MRVWAVGTGGGYNFVVFVCFFLFTCAFVLCSLMCSLSVCFNKAGFFEGNFSWGWGVGGGGQFDLPPFIIVKQST